MAPQYRQFYSIFESFKISDQKAAIAPPVLALPTALSSKTAPEDTDEMDDLEDVSYFLRYIFFVEEGVI